MPRIRCHYMDCVFLEEGYCGARSVELDPDEGCLTYKPDSVVLDDETWDDDELIEDEWEELEIDEEDEEIWLDDDDY